MNAVTAHRRRTYQVGRLILLWTSILLSSCITSQSHQATPVRRSDKVWNAENIAHFEKHLEALRKRYNIPSISAGIVNERNLIWKKGFGYADVENKVVPDEHTAYHLASVTKTFGAIILMQLAEQGKISLEDPIAKYGIDLGGRWDSDKRIKVKHLLTHTAAGNDFNGYKPGYSFKYNGDWYNRLGQVIEKASGETFGQLLTANIISPLHLANTVPSIDDSINFKLSGYDPETFRSRIAKPYTWGGGRLHPVQSHYGFGPAAGLMSSVSDLAIYSNAIDDGMFLKRQTWEQVFTPYVTPTGRKLRYGYGWFVKYYLGVKIVWHTGWWFGYSSLFIKIPEKDLTFIILANSQDLSRPFYLTLYPPIPLPNPFKTSLGKDLFVSDFARAFIEHFSGM
ncbi:beta-lactamase family protein [Flavihumibacter sp. R14]|nr:beta-lactamase family protein [Flavihumibacter soli]